MAAAGVTVTAWLAAGRNGLVAVSTWLPAAVSDTPTVKVCVPASAAVNVYDAGWVSAAVAPPMATVPVNPAAGLPSASTAVTVTLNGTPATTDAGADTWRLVALARRAWPSAALTSTFTAPAVPAIATSSAPSPLKSPTAAPMLDVAE